MESETSHEVQHSIEEAATLLNGKLQTLCPWPPYQYYLLIGFPSCNPTVFLARFFNVMYSLGHCF